MGLFGKLQSIAKEQGIAAIAYLIKEKLKDRTSQGLRYRMYLREELRCKKRLAASPKDSSVGLAVVLPGQPLFMQLEKVDQTACYVAFLREGDELSPDWEQEIAVFLLRHPDIRMLYTDEDILEKGKRTRPVFKPDWSPDTYLSFDYIGGLLVLERELAKQALADMHNTAHACALYELGLRASHLVSAEEIGHLSEVLYHRTQEVKILDEEVLRMKRRLFQEWKLQAAVQSLFVKQAAMENVGTASGTFLPLTEVIYPVNKQSCPLVSIIVPSKDHPALLRTCLTSVEAGTRYPSVEWIIVDNGSSPKNREAYEALCRSTRFPSRYVYEPMEFNFSRMCNLGAKRASGQYLLFLNDDMELIDQGKERSSELPEQVKKTDAATEKTVVNDNTDEWDWLERLVGQAAQSHTGAVGAKLLYPDSRSIQHIGVVNYTSGAAHVLWQETDAGVLPFCRNITTQNCAIVTGACLLISTEKFQKVGGFEEKLAVTFNDVELCIKLLKEGWYNVVRNDVVFYHHESISRGQDVLDEKKFLRGLKERELLFDLHPDYIGKDPFYSRHLTQTRLNHTMDVPKRRRFAKEVTLSTRQAVSEERETKTLHSDGYAEKTAALQQDRQEGMIAGSSPLRGRLLRISRERGLLIEGWAYDSYGGHKPTILLLEDENKTLRGFTTQKVYSPTIAKEQQCKHKIPFCEFYCFLPDEEVPPGNYKVGVQIADKRLFFGWRSI